MSNTFSAPLQSDPTPNVPAVSPAPAGSDKGGVNLHKSFSRVQESLATLFDKLAVPRSFTIPYIEGQATAEHVQAVGKTAAETGGLAKNLVTSFHHEDGKGYGYGDGSTVAHAAQDLREAIIPKSSEPAISVLSAAQTHLNNLKKLLGHNDPTIKTAQAQLDMIKTRDGAGMTAYDLGVGITALLTPPIQAVARSHNATKSNPHSPKLQQARS